MTAKARTLIADDEPLARDRIRALLEDEEPWRSSARPATVAARSRRYAS